MAKVEQKLGIVKLIKRTVLNSVSKKRERIAGVSRDMESTNYPIYNIYFP